MCEMEQRNYDDIVDMLPIKEQVVAGSKKSGGEETQNSCVAALRKPYRHTRDRADKMDLPILPSRVHRRLESISDNTGQSRRHVAHPVKETGGPSVHRVVSSQLWLSYDRGTC